MPLFPLPSSRLSSKGGELALFPHPISLPKLDFWGIRLPLKKNSTPQASLIKLVFGCFFNLKGRAFGVVLVYCWGECLLNIHPGTFPLYKGLAADWGKWCPFSRHYGSQPTTLRFVAHEEAAHSPHVRFLQIIPNLFFLYLPNIF